MTDELVIDSENFISSKRASELSGYSQDYIGQLARGGEVDARRVGGLWYVRETSIKNYRAVLDEHKPEPPIRENLHAAESLLSFDGRPYVSAAVAAKITGYHPDYVGQLARNSGILAKQIGNRWYIDKEGILSHKKSKDALLAAVQADSVGLHKTNMIASPHQHREFFTYTSDSGELLPTIQVTTKENLPDLEEDTYPVPIRVLGKSSATNKSEQVYSYKEEEVREPGKTSSYIVIPVVLTTIVLILSFSFLSLRKDSLYTFMSVDDLQESQLASTGYALLTKVADMIESILVQEIQYKRTD